MDFYEIFFQNHSGLKFRKIGHFLDLLFAKLNPMFLAEKFLASTLLRSSYKLEIKILLSRLLRVQNPKQAIILQKKRFRKSMLWQCAMNNIAQYCSSELHHLKSRIREALLLSTAPKHLPCTAFSRPEI